MADMKSMSTKKVVTIEEFAVQLDRGDIAELIEMDNPTNTVSPRDVTVCVSAPSDEARVGDFSVAQTRIIGASQLLEMARTKNPEIPADAEIVLAVRWQKAVEGAQIQPMQPQYAPSAMVPAPPGYAHVAPGGQPIAPQDALQCATCGGVPGIQGPTPDCQDVNGCGRVRALRGDLPVPKSVDPAGAPQVGVGLGVGTPGTKMLVNRETGQKVFADKKGAPYGVHDDYTR